MSKKILILIMALLLLLPVVSAFQVYLNPAEEDSHRIYVDEVARYILTINNSKPYKVVYSLNVNPVEWVLESSSSFAVEANSVVQVPFNLKPKPTNYRSPGTYYIPLSIESSDNEIVEKQIVLYIKSFKPGYGDYIAAVSVDVLMPLEVDLRDKILLQLNLRNRNMLEIEGMEIDIDGGFFQKTDYVNLSGLAQKTVQYNFDIKESIFPGDHIVTVKTRYLNKTLSEVEKSFEVIPYSVIDRTKTETSSWFKKVIVSKLTNNGNIPKKVTTSLDSPWYVRLFTYVDVEASTVERTGGTWVITLEPTETANFIVYENYRYSLGFLILLILGIIAYFNYRSPIVLQKQIVITGKDQEGISEMKVRIFVRNRTAKSFFNLRLIDKAPSIAHVLSNESVGVVQPTKIIPTDKKGTIVKWDVDSIEAFEERIFTYTLKAKLKIIGNLSLPSVKAKFEDVKGDERTVSSPKAIIGAKTN